MTAKGSRYLTLCDHQLCDQALQQLTVMNRPGSSFQSSCCERPFSPFSVRNVSDCIPFRECSSILAERPQGRTSDSHDRSLR